MEDLTFSSTTLAKIVQPSFSVILIERIKGHLAVCKNESGGDSYYYFLQDFGDSKFCGNCFVIVAKLLGYNLNTDFKRLLEQIDRDMKLNVFSSYDDGFHSKQVKLKKVIAYGSKEKQCSISEFKPITKHFSDKELEY